MVSRRRQRGITYLWVLFLVFLMGLGLGKTLDVYSVSLQREKEQELLYVGDVYRMAIRNYYLGSPGGQRKYPEQLADLLLDKRNLTPRRYLRQLYPDPMTGKPFQVLMAPEGGISGVASTSEAAPRKVAGFDERYASFATALSYQDWQFVYEGRN